MHTDDSLRPLPQEGEKMKMGFGRNVIARLVLKSVGHDDEFVLQQNIKEDLAYAGPQGILSLIRALMELGNFTRVELLEFGSAICGPPTSQLFEELLDMFEGDTPRRDLWRRGPDGFYRPNYRR